MAFAEQMGCRRGKPKLKAKRTMASDPFHLFDEWLAEARASEPNDPEAMALATEISGYSLPALMVIKDSVNRAYESSLAEGIAYERRQLHARFASADASEGMAAFLEKRPPRFQHC